VPGHVFYEASRKLILKGRGRRGIRSGFTGKSGWTRISETMENLQEH